MFAREGWSYTHVHACFYTNISCEPIGYSAKTLQSGMRENRYLSSIYST